MCQSGLIMLKKGPNEFLETQDNKSGGTKTRAAGPAESKQILKPKQCTYVYFTSG